MVSYIFGGNTGLTPEDVKRQRALAAALAEARTPQNAGEGVGAVMRGLAGALVNYRANKAETEGRKAATDAFNPILDALRSPSSATTDAVTTSTPGFTTDAAAKKQPQSSVMDKSLPPVEGTMANARTGDRNSVQNYAGLDLKSGIKSAADSLGIKPEDLATAISYETGGTFDPLQKGPKTKWGQHRGLIQFGEPQAIETGVDWNDPLNSQLGPDGAVVKYLRAAGVKPGMGLLDIYSAINAGGVNRYDASDEKNGGAWGTVADKVKYQMDGHRKKALALFAENEDPSAFDAQPNLDKPVEVASLDGNVPVVPVPEGFQQPDPLAEAQQQPVEMAQATQPKRSANEPSDEAIINAIMNPWATDAQRGVAEMYYKQRLSDREFQRKLEAERNDPKRKLELEKLSIETEQLRNPKQAKRLTEEEEKAEGFDTSGVYERLPDGSTKVVQEPKKRNTVTVNGQVIDVDTKEVIAEVPQQVSPIEQDKAALDREKFEWEKTKKPDTIQKYEYYKQAAEAAGEKPLGPLEWERALRSSSAQTTTVNNNMKTEGEFEKEAAKKQAEFFSTLADDGLNARSDLEIISQLDTFLQGQGGLGTGLSTALSKWGIPFEGADDLQAADALINKLVPTQRAPGSGTMSDRDVQLFKDSLPSLWNQPGGNQKILGVMRGMAEYKSRQGEIADMVLNGDMTRQEGRRALRELPNPLEEFRNAKRDEKSAQKPAEKAADDLPAAPEGMDMELWKIMTPEERKLWQN